MKIRYRLPTFGLITILLLVACQLEREPAIINTPLATVTGTVKDQISSESTPTSLPPTATRVIGNEITSARVNGPTASATVVLATATSPSMLVTATVTAVTLTPLPTLTADELDGAVAELLANPMTCDVPCWWGAVPNTTTAMETLQFLSHYQFTFHERYEYDNLIPDFIEVWVGFDENENQFDFRVMYSFENNLLQGILAEQSRSLDEVLTRYGQPDEVWLATGITPLPIPVRLNLVYYQEAMALGYVADGSFQNGVIIGCFSGEEPGRIQLNTPDNLTDYKDFRGIFEEDRTYLPLDEAANLTMEDFIQRFSDPAQPQCIETPIELWE